MAKMVYYDIVTSKLRKARKDKNAEAAIYYGQALNKVAAASFENFKGSWAYEQWLITNKNLIEEEHKALHRFTIR